MLPTRQAEIEAKAKRQTTLVTTRTSLAVAIIAATASVASVAFNYWFTDRVRTNISDQTLALEAIKVDLAKSAQKTADTVAMIDAARLELQRQAAAIENARLDIERQAADIDAARLVIQRQLAVSSTRNESRRTDIDDQRRKADQIRLATDLAKAKAQLLPTMEPSCTVTWVSQQRLTLECTFKNTGTNRIFLQPVASFDFLDLDLGNDSFVAGAITKVDGDSRNNVPVGLTASNTFNIYLSEIGQRVKRKAIAARIRATTDEIAVNSLRAIAQGYVSEKDLGSLSSQEYRIVVPLQ